MNHNHISTFLNLVLRHKPHLFNVQIDANGWTDVGELIARINEHDVPLTMELLEEIVASNHNQRFGFNDNHSMIKASQRHFVKNNLALELQLQFPPQVLYHGTIQKFLNSIKKGGLDKIGRDHVHLSADEITAFKVGAKKGSPVVLIIEAAKMQADGFSFYLSKRGVWLTDNVPAEYIVF